MAWSLQLILPAGRLAPDDVPAVCLALASWLQRLAGGLGLPESAPPTITVADGSAAACRCGGETVNWPLPPDASAESIAALAALAWFRARDRLWTPARARAFWRRHTPAERHRWTGDAGFAAALLKLLRALARQGLSAQRVAAVWQNWDTMPIDASRFDAVFEQLAADAAPAGLALRLSPTQHAAWLADGSFAAAAAQLGADLYRDLGLLMHVAEPVADTTLQAPWFQLRLNDLDLPPLRGIDDDQTLDHAAHDRRAVLGLHADDKPLRVAAGSWYGWGPAQVALLGAGLRLLWQEAAACMNTNVLELMWSGQAAWPLSVQMVRDGWGAPRVSAVLRHLLDEQVSVRDQRGVLEALLAIRGDLQVDARRHIVLLPEHALPLWRSPNAADMALRAPSETTTMACPYADCQQPVPAGGATCPACARTIAACPRCAKAIGAATGFCDHCGWNGDLAQATASAEEAAQCVRMRLRRQLAQAVGGDTLFVTLLDPELEALLERRPLHASQVDRLRSAVREELRSASTRVNVPLLLTTVAVRPLLRALLRDDWPELTVLCYQELPATASIQMLGRIELVQLLRDA
jgi:hypothetical protein